MDNLYGTTTMPLPLFPDGFAVPLYVNRPLFTDEDVERALVQELAA